MNLYVQYFLIGIGCLMSLGLTAGGLGYLISQFRKGERTQATDSNEQIKFYKEQAENYKDMMEKKDVAHMEHLENIRKEFGDKNAEIMRQLGEVQGAYQKEKELREQYEAIAKDKNPELKAILSEIKDFMKSINLHMERHEIFMEKSSKDLKIEATVSQK